MLFSDVFVSFILRVKAAPAAGGLIGRELKNMHEHRKGLSQNGFMKSFAITSFCYARGLPHFLSAAAPFR